MRLPFNFYFLLMQYVIWVVPTLFYFNSGNYYPKLSHPWLHVPYRHLLFSKRNKARSHRRSWSLLLFSFCLRNIAKYRPKWWPSIYESHDPLHKCLISINWDVLQSLWKWRKEKVFSTQLLLEGHVIQFFPLCCRPNQHKTIYVVHAEGRNCKVLVLCFGWKVDGLMIQYLKPHNKILAGLDF